MVLSFSHKNEKSILLQKCFWFLGYTIILFAALILLRNILASISLSVDSDSGQFGTYITRFAKQVDTQTKKDTRSTEVAKTYFSVAEDASKITVQPQQTLELLRDLRLHNVLRNTHRVIVDQIPQDDLKLSSPVQQVSVIGLDLSDINQANNKKLIRQRISAWEQEF